MGGCTCREVGGVYVEKGGVHVIVPKKYAKPLYWVLAPAVQPRMAVRGAAGGNRTAVDRVLRRARRIVY